MDRETDRIQHDPQEREATEFKDLPEDKQDYARESLGEAVASEIWELADDAADILKLIDMARDLDCSPAHIRLQACRCNAFNLRRLDTNWHQAQEDACREFDDAAENRREVEREDAAERAAETDEHWTK